MSERCKHGVWAADHCWECGAEELREQDRVKEDLRTKLHRAKEIIGSFHAQLSPVQKAFWEELEEMFNPRPKIEMVTNANLPKDVFGLRFPNGQVSWFRIGEEGKDVQKVTEEESHKER